MDHAAFAFDRATFAEGKLALIGQLKNSKG